jgi:carboxylesterase type B
MRLECCRVIEEWHSGRVACDHLHVAARGPSDADVPAQSLRLQSDSFAYGAYSMAQAITRAGQPAYLYYFTYAEKGRRAALGAYHGEELNFLCDSFPNDWEHGPDDERLGQAMRTYWAEFAKTGNPNAKGAPEWPAYSARADQYLELGREIRIHPVTERVQVLGYIEGLVLGETANGGTPKGWR